VPDRGCVIAGGWDGRGHRVSTELDSRLPGFADVGLSEDDLKDRSIGRWRRRPAHGGCPWSEDVGPFAVQAERAAVRLRHKLTR
jgi:hypothetical protein